MPFHGSPKTSAVASRFHGLVRTPNWKTLARAREAVSLLAGANCLDGKRGDSDATWAKVNFDRQIVAVAKVNGASVIYSDDIELIKFAKRIGIEAVSSWDLPEPQLQQAAFEFKQEQAKARAVSLEEDV